MGPFIILMPVLTKIADRAMQETMSIVLTENGLQYDVAKGVESTLAAVNTVQQQVSAVQEGIAQQTLVLGSIQSSIGVIGAMSAAGVGLSAVNAYQLMKIQRKLNEIGEKIDNGFVDLKKHISEKLDEFWDKQQKRQLAEAYNWYSRGLERLETALLMNDEADRRRELSFCIDNFNKALVTYDNKQEYENFRLPVKLRHLECCWAMESAIAEVHCIRKDYNASLYCYKKLAKRIFSEIIQLKKEVSPDNFNFFLADIHWLYENDLRIIDAKMKLLEEYAIGGQFQPVPIEIMAASQAENFCKEISFLGAVEYLEVLTDQAKKNKMETYLAEQNTPTTKNLRKLPMADKFRLFYDMTGSKWLEISIQDELIEIVKKFRHKLAVNKNIYVLNDILPKKLQDTSNFQAKIAKNEKPFVLIEWGRLGFFSEGILLTDQRICCHDRPSVEIGFINSVGYSEAEGLLYINGGVFTHVSLSDKKSCIFFVEIIKEMISKLYEISYNQGIALLKLSRHEEAINCFRKAIMVKPDDLACYEKLAEHSKEEIYKNKYLSMLARTARYADAVVFAAKSLILSPQRSAEFWDNYGFSLLKLGRYQEALDCAEKFLGIRQNDYKMSWRQVLLLIKLEKYEAAISVLEKLPKRDEVVMSMLFLLSRLGKFDKALALSNMFFDEKTPNLKALFHSLAGDLETAIQLQGKS